MRKAPVPLGERYENRNYCDRAVIDSHRNPAMRKMSPIRESEAVTKRHSFVFSPFVAVNNIYNNCSVQKVIVIFFVYFQFV